MSLTVTVLQDGPTDYGKLKAMVEAGKASWDVVDVEYDFAIKAAKDGLLEPLDFGVTDKSTIDPRLPQPITPSVLPVISTPMNLFFSHLPDWVEA